jgi:hypothetical protein
LGGIQHNGHTQFVFLFPEAARALVDILAVERQNFESLASVDTHGPKMPLI